MVNIPLAMWEKLNVGTLFQTLTKACNNNQPTILLFQNVVVTFPFPKVFVGVFTDINMRSAALTALSTSEEKNRLIPRHFCTT